MIVKAADLAAQALELGISATQFKSLTQDKKIALLAAVNTGAQAEALASIATSLAALEGQVLAASTPAP